MKKLEASREATVWILRELVRAGHLAHVSRDHDFEDKKLFYRFGSDDSTAAKRGARGRQGGLRGVQGQFQAALGPDANGKNFGSQLQAVLGGSGSGKNIGGQFQAALGGSSSGGDGKSSPANEAQRKGLANDTSLSSLMTQSKKKTCRCQGPCPCAALGANFVAKSGLENSELASRWKDHVVFLDDSCAICALPYETPEQVLERNAPKKASAFVGPQAPRAMDNDLTRAEYQWRDPRANPRRGFSADKVIPLVGLLDVSEQELSDLVGLSKFPSLRTVLAKGNRLRFGGASPENPPELCRLQTLRSLDLSFNFLPWATVNLIMSLLVGPLEYLDISSSRNREAFYVNFEDWPCIVNGHLQRLRFMHNDSLKVKRCSRPSYGWGGTNLNEATRCTWRLLPRTFALDVMGTMTFVSVLPQQLDQSAYVIVPDCMKRSDGSVRAPAFLEYVMNAETGIAHNVFVRMMVVGYAGVGKTTLTEALLDSRSAVGSAVRRVRGYLGRRRVTFGVDIEEDWQPSQFVRGRKASPSVYDLDLSASGGVMNQDGDIGPPPEGSERVQVWDFAGQPEYYPIHLMFMDSEALFLLCYNIADALKSQEALVRTIDYLEEWMALIGARAGNVPVLLVGTQLGSISPAGSELDGLRRALDSFLARTRKRPAVSTPKIAGSYFTNALGNLVGIDELRAACCKASTRILASRPPVPSGYVKLRKVIAKHSESVPICSTREFAKLLSSSGSVIVFTDIRKTLRLLHSWGFICFFDSIPTLSDTVFLNPQWLAKMLAHVATKLRQSDGSKDHQFFVFRDELAAVWKDQPVEIVDSVIEAMRAFELLFAMNTACEHEFFLDGDLIDEVAAVNSLEEVEVNGEMFVVPGLLPHKPPKAVSELRERLLIGYQRRKRESTLSQSSRSSITSFGEESEGGSRASSSASESGESSPWSESTFETTERRYDFSVLPAGFLSRLILRFFAEPRFGIISAWQSGIAVRTGFGAATVEQAEGSLRALVVFADCNACANLVEEQIILLRNDLCNRVAVYRSGVLLAAAKRGDRASSAVPIIDYRDLVVDVKQDELLGRGSFGEVFICVAKDSARVLDPGHAYAVKVASRASTEQQLIASRLQQEYAVMEQFSDHLHLVPAVARMVDIQLGLTTGIVLPLYDESLERLVRFHRDILRGGGATSRKLATHVNSASSVGDEGDDKDGVNSHGMTDDVLFCERMNNRWFGAHRVKDWVRQITLGLKHLHEAGVAHLDLKLDNVLAKQVSRGVYELALTDFGVSHDAYGVGDEHGKLSVGTRGWVAPEVEAAAGKDGAPFNPFRADLYSLGVMVRVLLTGVFPTDKQFNSTGSSPPTSSSPLPGSNEASDDAAVADKAPQLCCVLDSAATFHRQSPIVTLREWRALRLVFHQCCQLTPKARMDAAGVERALRCLNQARAEGGQQQVLEGYDSRTDTLGEDDDSADEDSVFLGGHALDLTSNLEAIGKCLDPRLPLRRDRELQAWFVYHRLGDLLEAPALRAQTGDQLARLTEQDLAQLLAGDSASASDLKRTWNADPPYRAKQLKSAPLSFVG